MKAGAKDVEELALVWDLLGSAQVIQRNFSNTKMCVQTDSSVFRYNLIFPQPFYFNVYSLFLVNSLFLVSYDIRGVY